MNKILSATLLSAALLTTSATSFAQESNWPTRAVQVVVPANAGGDTDFNARMMAKYFTQITGKPMVITNMGGGGGTVAASHVKESAADGHTILFTHTGQLIVNEVAGLSEDSYDAFDISCIAGVDKASIFVASKQSGIDSVEKLIAQAKEKPKSISYGTEMGNFSHLQGLMFEKRTGTELRYIDTGTVAERIVALLGGRIDMGAISYGALQDYIQSGAMNALAQPNEERNPLVGDIPTFREKDVDLIVEKPYVVAFPKGTDAAIVAKMAEVMKQITEIPSYGEELAKTYKQPVAYYGTDDAIAMLKEHREEFMQFKDALRQSN